MAPKNEQSNTAKIFFCYAREDEALRDELQKQLRILQRQGLITSWHDREISAGEEWVHEIDKHLKSAQIILLLVSPDFMASDYCYGVEMIEALERHEAGEARVIPIILRPVAWQDAPFSKLQVLPTDGEPVTNWSSHDKAFLDITNGIRKVVKAHLASAKVNYGDTFYKEERYEESLAAYEQAIQLDPTLASAYLSKGNVLSILKRYAQALAVYEQAIQLDPTLASAQRGKDMILEQLEKSIEVQQQLEARILKIQQQFEAQQLEAQQSSEAQQLEAQQLKSQLATAQRQFETQQLEAQQLESQLAATQQQLAAQLHEIQALRSQLLQAQQQLEDQQLAAQQHLAAQRLESQRLEAQLVETQRQLAAQRLESQRLEAQLGEIKPQTMSTTLGNAAPAQINIHNPPSVAASTVPTGELQPVAGNRRTANRPTNSVLARWSQLRLEVAQLTDVGRKRDHNEDNMAYVLPRDAPVMAMKGALFMVADGISEYPAGEVASEIAVDTVSNVYYMDDNIDVAVPLLQAIKRANAAIHQRASENMLRSGMCSTFVAAVLRGNTAYIANVGDSRAYLIRQSQIKQISLDHSWMAEQVRSGLLTEKQARTHSRHNEITRTLGSRPDVEVDMFREQIQPGDYLVLCTNGLYNLMSSDELMRIVEKYPPQESVYHLVQRANENGRPDDITVQVIQVLETGPEPPRS